MCVALLLTVTLVAIIHTPRVSGEEGGYQSSSHDLANKVSIGEDVPNITLLEVGKISMESFIHTPMWDNNGVLFFNMINENRYIAGEYSIDYEQNLYKAQFNGNGGLKVELLHDNLELCDVRSGTIVGKSYTHSGNNIVLLKNNERHNLGAGKGACLRGTHVVVIENRNGRLSEVDINSMQRKNPCYLQGENEKIMGKALSNPDGDSIAWVSEAHKLNLMVNNEVSVVIDDIGTSLGSTLPDFVWMNNAASLVAITSGPAPQIVIINTTKEIRTIKKKMFSHLATPSLSPDDKYLFYMARQTGNDINCLCELYVLNMVTGKEVRLTDDTIEQRSPVLSPDGQYLAYIVGDSELVIAKVIWE